MRLEIFCHLRYPYPHPACFASATRCQRLRHALPEIGSRSSAKPRVKINGSPTSRWRGFGAGQSVAGDLLEYASASTDDQRAHLQLDVLKAAGCQRVWSDTVSGPLTERPELAELFDHLRPGDTLVVWCLDRLGRSVRHLIDVGGELGERAWACGYFKKESTPLRPVVALFSMSFRR